MNKWNTVAARLPIDNPCAETKAQCRKALAALVQRYNETFRGVSKAKVTEETIRAWINDFLAVFGWDVRNIKQVWQEAVLDERNRRRLSDINSTHKRPDYTLLNGGQIKAFLDAKSLAVDIFTSQATAFQIRSYGWSAQVPCSFVSNFEQTVIYDTRYVPNVNQDASYGAIQIAVTEYLDKFDVLFDHLWRGNVVANGLEKLYATTPREGNKALDAQFMRVLSDFRVKLAAALSKNNASVIKDDDLLNYYVQVIMDRIIFIRVCESKGIEKSDRIRAFQKSREGFWRSFRESCYMEFYRHYDGAMFERDAKFKSIELDDAVFAGFIDSLYYPCPYRFDVIPVMMLAKIYEEFLGKRLVIRRGIVSEEIKGEYVKTNGAIPTPECLVRFVCSKTFDPAPIKSVTRFFDTKILDPCCGSGIFLIACYDYLEKQFIELLKSNDEIQRQYEDFYFVDGEGNWLLTIPGRRLLIVKCLFGVDVDEAAVEVTKMSLALKILDGNCVTIWDSMGANGERILRDIAENVKLGNSLVPLSASLSAKQKDSLKAFDPTTAFPSVFKDGRSGFSYIVCNPPYVETKYFKDAQPELHKYLFENYDAYEGKADLAVLFIERCGHLLSDSGQIGLIVQRRWFKAEYGKGIRRLIDGTRQLKEMIEFEATDLFPRRTTYVAVMTLSRTANREIAYARISGDGAEVMAKFANPDDAMTHCAEVMRTVEHPQGEDPWDFNENGIGKIYRRLLSQHGNLGRFPGLAIKDGVQALWKKAYHFTDVEFAGDVATGTNGFGDRVCIEKDILRGVVYNLEFYPFKKIQPDAWCLFPYKGASADAIEFSKLQKAYPLAYDYLKANRKRIQEYVECRAGEKWHTFTREHNHGLYNADKIVIPMTARDTIATFVAGDNGLYMDNANVWFIRIDHANVGLMKSVAAIINSTTFSVLAKSTANPQSGGYFKFNKQFLSPVPFPSAALLQNDGIQKRLSKLYDQIFALEEKFIASRTNPRNLISQQLAKHWTSVDEITERLYGLTATESRKIAAIGRSVNRIELLPKE